MVAHLLGFWRFLLLFLFSFKLVLFSIPGRLKVEILKSKNCTSLQKVIYYFNQRLLKIRLNGTGQYHGSIPITIKELKI
jgi:hypothetical protein